MTIWLKKILRWNHIPAFVVMATLFYLSSREGGDTPWLHPPMDKVIHWFAYFWLGMSFCICIRHARWMRSRIGYGLLVVAFVAAFGVSDEFHQGFVPGRQVSLGDWAADLAGGVTAVILFLATRAHRLTQKII
jgi:VanZ family protein